MSLFSDLHDKVFSPKAADQVAQRINEATVLGVLRTIIDPDLHQDIVSLGFIKNLLIADRRISMDLELTTAACPVKEQMKSACETKLKALAGIDEVEVRLQARTRSNRLNLANQGVGLKDVKNIVAVASGKGGVGKSTSTVGLAYALARSGCRVGILDADIYGPSIPLMTGVATPTEFKENLVIPPMVSGVKIISISMFQGSKDKAFIWRGPMAGQAVKQLLSQVNWGDLDYLLIDYPPGTGDIQLTLSQITPITAAVIVTTPQNLALIDVKRSIDAFKTLKVPILGIVETMSYFICDGCDKKHYIFRQGGGKKLADENGVAFLGEVPIQPQIAECSDGAAPKSFLENHPTPQAYQEVAGRFAAELSMLNQQGAGGLSEFKIHWKTEEQLAATCNHQH